MWRLELFNAAQSTKKNPKHSDRAQKYDNNLCKSFYNEKNTNKHFSGMKFFDKTSHHTQKSQPDHPGRPATRFHHQKQKSKVSIIGSASNPQLDHAARRETWIFWDTAVTPTLIHTSQKRRHQLASCCSKAARIIDSPKQVCRHDADVK